MPPLVQKNPFTKLSMQAQTYPNTDTWVDFLPALFSTVHQMHENSSAFISSELPEPSCKKISSLRFDFLRKDMDKEPSIPVSQEGDSTERTPLHLREARRWHYNSWQHQIWRKEESTSISQGKTRPLPPPPPSFLLLSKNTSLLIAEHTILCFS